MSSRRVFLLGTARNETNRNLVAAWSELEIDVELASPFGARSRIRPGDIAIGRLDVLPTLDGVEPGLLELLLLERAGIRVLNGARALLGCHDKWRTARLLELAALPQPRTTLLAPDGSVSLDPPLVIKPRFGSWGADVERCGTLDEVAACLARASATSWFRRHGALLQELVPSTGVDLRLVVASGQVVGAIERVARPGEWRTNTSLGATRRPVDPPEDACELAVSAAAAVGAELVGIDLLPLAGGGYTVLELNGAVDFTPEYGLRGRDAYELTAEAIGLRSPNAQLRA